MASNDPDREFRSSITTLKNEIEGMNKQIKQFLSKSQQELEQHRFDAAIEAIKSTKAVHQDMIETKKELEEKQKALNDLRQKSQQP